MTSKNEVLEAMRREIGQEDAPGEWFTVDQSLIDQFVSISGEESWIHTDPERAAKSKFGATIAPGNLGVALMPRLSRGESAYARYPRKYSLNQGWDRIRYLAPLKTGSRVRARSRLLDVGEQSDGSLRVQVEYRLEIEGEDKPWVTGVKVGRFFFEE